MNLVSAFKSEIFRPLATIVVPGFVGVAPYILVSNCYNPQILEFWQTSPSAFVGILVLIVLAAGLILEDIGSRIESTLWDPLMRRKKEEYKEVWVDYLKLFMKDDVVGQRYLRTIVVRLKFELSMGPALIFALVGLVWFNQKSCVWSQGSFFWLSIGIGTVGAYLLWESYASVELLHDIRSLLVEAVHKRDKV